MGSDCGDDLVTRQRQLRACLCKGVSEGDVTPSEAGKSCIFGTEIVQFGEYF